MPEVVGDLVVKITGDASELENALKRIGSELSTFGGQLQSIGTSMSVAITAPLVAVATAGLKVAGSMEQAGIAFKTMLGSAQAATAHLDSLKKFALATRFEFPELVRASQKLQALGFTAKEVIPTLTAVGNAAAALNSGSQGIERITLALGQMQAKGKVSAQEMRQLSDAGINSWQILADAMSAAEKRTISVAEVMKRAEKGFVDGNMAVSALIAGMQTKFGGLMEAQSQTLLGTFAKFKEQLTFTLVDIGNILMPVAKDVLGSLAGVGEKIRELTLSFAELPKGVQTAAIGFAAFAAAIGPIVYISGQLISGFGTVLTFFSQFAAAASGSSLLAAGLSGAMTVLATTVAAVAAAFAAVEIGKFLFDLGRFIADTGVAQNAIRNLGSLIESLPGMKIISIIVREIVQRVGAAATAAREIAPNMLQILHDESGIGGLSYDDASAVNTLKQGVARTVSAQQPRFKSATDDIDEFGRKSAAALRAAEEAAKKAEAELAKLFGTIGLTNTSKTLKETERAFDALKGRLSDPQLLEAGHKLEGVFEAAKKAGIIDADEFDRGMAKVRASIGQLEADMQAKAKTRPFLLTALLGDYDLAGEGFNLNGLKTQGEAFQQWMAGVAENTAKADAAVEAMTQDLAALQAELAKLPQTGPLIPAIAAKAMEDSAKRGLQIAKEEHEGPLRAVGIRGRADLDTQIDANNRIQQGPYADDVKLQSALATQRRVIEMERERAGLNTRMLEQEIQLRTIRGESVTQYMIQLEQLQIAEQMRIDKLQFWGNMYKDIMKDIQSISGMVTKTLVDQIIEIDKNDSAWMKLGKNIAKMFLETIIGGVLKQLTNELIRMSGLVGGLGKLFGAGPGVAGVAGLAKLAGIGPGGVGAPPIQLPGEMPVGGDIGFKTVSEAGGASGLMTGLGIANLGVGVASGIATGIQLAHIESDVAKIEISTRQCKEQLVGGIQTVLNTYLPELVHLVDLWGAITGGPMGEIRDILRYGKINVNVVRGEGGTGSANDILNGGFEPALPPKPPVGQGTVVEPIEAPELSGFEANANSRRGLGNFNVGSLSAIVDGLETAAKAIDKTADVFAGSGLTPSMTTAQALAAGAARFGVSVEQFKAAMDDVFDKLDENSRRGVSRSDVYQPVFGNTSIFADDSTDPNKQAQLKAIRDSLELYRAGNISYAAYITAVQAATDKYQLQIASIDTLISRFSRLSDASTPEAKSILKLIEAQGGVLSTPGVAAGYEGGGRAATNFSAFTSAFQAIQQSGFGGTANLGNSSFINAAMGFTGMSGEFQYSAEEKADLIAKFIDDPVHMTGLKQLAEKRGREAAQMLEDMQNMAGMQFAKAFESATAGRNIRMDSTGHFFQLDQAGNLIDADTGKALMNYEQAYNQFANPTGVPTGMQGTSDLTRTNSFGGTTRMVSNQLAYGAPPVDYNALLGEYITRLNTSYQTQTPMQYMGSMFGGSGGGMYAPITQNIYTNDPQVVANQLTTSLWSSGFKTR